MESMWSYKGSFIFLDELQTWLVLEVMSNDFSPGCI